MDAVDVMANTINVMSLGNGGHPNGLHALGIIEAASDNIERDASQLEERESIDFSSAESNGGTVCYAESEVVAVSKELGEKNPNQENNSKSMKVQDKPKRATAGTENLTNSKAAVVTCTRKNVVRNQEVYTLSTSNGLTSRPKKPLAHTSNGRKVVEGCASVDMPEKVQAVPSITDFSEPEVSKEQRESLKPLKQNTSDKDEEHPLSPSSAKPRRLGTTPTYNFSFKCNERAEKRKEFYSKLEEKIHAKEVEKSNLQAKTKEHQEAEIKLLRKNLAFKATPMPTFYQEPAPPKMELKKIPTTRAKSPKFGRQKSSSDKEKTTDIEGNHSHNSRSIRLSLGDRVSRNVVASDPSLRLKKPHRKSLPILFSQRETTTTTEIPPPVQEPENQKSDQGGTQPTQSEIQPIEPADKQEEPVEQELVCDHAVSMDGEEKSSEEQFS